MASEDEKSEFMDIEELDEDISSESEEENSTELYLPQDQEGGEGEEMEVDLSAYHLLHNFNTNWPCLSFSILPDNLGNDRSFPVTCYLAAGTQSPDPKQNELVIMKLSNLNRIDPESDSESEADEDEAKKTNNPPSFQSCSIPHYGAINRVNSFSLPKDNVHLCATWADTGYVNIFNISQYLPNLPSLLTKKKLDPIFNIKHSTEGYALNFNPTGTQIVTGCNKGLIIVTDIKAMKSTQKYINPGFGSIEDIQWSSTESNVFISCSSDKNIRVWDVRTNNNSMINWEAHNEDVNVIDWNPTSSHLLVSGSDSGEFSVWDLRNLSNRTPVASFNWHKKPITSLNWSSYDESVIAVSSDDHSISIWDFAVEADGTADTFSNGVQVPDQLLFLHMGQKFPKEVKFHKQFNGVLLSTAQDGFNIFKPIST